MNTANIVVLVLLLYALKEERECSCGQSASEKEWVRYPVRVFVNDWATIGLEERGN